MISVSKNLIAHHCKSFLNMLEEEDLRGCLPVTGASVTQESDLKRYPELACTIMIAL